MPRISPDRLEERGFTLVELLIVIVILGILSTVTVFAVRGVTDEGQATACATEFRQLQTAQEMHRALNGVYGDEAALVSSGALAGPSSLFDTSPAGGDYAVTPTGSTCSQSSAGGPPIIPAADPPNTRAELRSTSFGSLGSFPQWGLRSGDPDGHVEILVFGRANGAADWAAMTGANVPTNRRATYFDIDTIGTPARLEDALATANATPPTSYVIYGSDDTVPFGTHADLAAALAAELTANPSWSGDVTTIDGVTDTITDHLLAAL